MFFYKLLIAQFISFDNLKNVSGWLLARMPTVAADNKKL
jgi:hypothetical protein